MTPEVREALVRIAREAVTNAARHGDAGLVRVELENGAGIKLRIVDDGRGFDAAAATRQTRRGGFGLVSMSERARAVGGVLHVASKRGAGTTVEVVERCTGMDGTWGFKHEYSAASTKVARPLFRELDELRPDLVRAEAADGAAAGTCAPRASRLACSTSGCRPAAVSLYARSRRAFQARRS